MIQFLQAIILVLTIALQPTTPPEVRQHIFVEVSRIMSQVKVEESLPINIPSMNQETPSPSAPAPAPSAPTAPETPTATSTPTASAPTDYTPHIEFLAEGNSLRWKTSGVGETLACTLNGKSVEQEGEAMTDLSVNVLRCVGVKSGTSVQQTITI